MAGILSPRSVLSINSGMELAAHSATAGAERLLSDMVGGPGPIPILLIRMGSYAKTNCLSTVAVSSFITVGAMTFMN